MNQEKREFELRKCVHCEVKYIEDAECIDVEIGGKPVLPEGCWRKDLIRVTPKPHNDV
jgi:hypothetical protein